MDLDALRREAVKRPWHYRHDLGNGFFTEVRDPWFNQWHPLREKLFFDAIEAKFGPSLAGKRCLDIACNSGYWSFRMAERGAEKVLSFDYETQLVEDARLVRQCRPDKPEYERIEFHNGSAYEFPFDAEKHDLVLALGIMYHLTDIVGVARKIYRATKTLAVIDSSVSDLRGEVLELASDERYFWCAPNEFALVPTREALIAILKHAGFRRVEMVHFLPSHPAYPWYAPPHGFRTLLLAEP